MQVHVGSEVGQRKKVHSQADALHLCVLGRRHLVPHVDYKCVSRIRAETFHKPLHVNLRNPARHSFTKASTSEAVMPTPFVSAASATALVMPPDAKYYREEALQRRK